MGIIQKDTLTLENGLEVSNTYASFAGDSIHVLKSSSNVISINATLSTWANQTSRLNNKPIIKTESINFSIENGSVTDELFKLLYEKYKSTSNGSYEDVLIDVVGESTTANSTTV